MNKERLESGLICMSYLFIRCQLVDLLMKGLNIATFQKVVAKLEMKNIYSSAWRITGEELLKYL